MRKWRLEEETEVSLTAYFMAMRKRTWHIWGKEEGLGWAESEEGGNDKQK